LEVFCLIFAYETSPLKGVVDPPPPPGFCYARLSSSKWHHRLFNINFSSQSLLAGSYSDSVFSGSHQGKVSFPHTFVPKMFRFCLTPVISPPFGRGGKWQIGPCKMMPFHSTSRFARFCNYVDALSFVCPSISSPYLFNKSRCCRLELNVKNFQFLSRACMAAGFAAGEYPMSGSPPLYLELPSVASSPRPLFSSVFFFYTGSILFGPR